MDTTLFRAINDLAGTSIVLDAIGIFAASWLLWVELVVIAEFWFLRQRERFITALCAIAASAGAWLVNQGIGSVYFRPRPFVVLAEMHKLISKSVDEKSFPSDHATIAFALAVSVLLVNPRWGTVLMVIAFVIALGRVYVGVHYPADVLGGAIVGCASALAVHYTTHRLLHSRHRSTKQL
jgi:undecaprenyl-diphosphatase